MAIVMMMAASAATAAVHAAEKAPWIEVRLHVETIAAADPNRIWSSEDLAPAGTGGGAQVEVGSAKVGAGEVVISRLEVPACNAECPTRVVLRRPGLPDAVLLDDLVYVGTPAGPERAADMIYRVRSDLSELDGGTGTDGKAVWPGGRGGVLKLDRSGLK